MTAIVSIVKTQRGPIGAVGAALQAAVAKKGA